MTNVKTRAMKKMLLLLMFGCIVQMLNAQTYVASSVSDDAECFGKENVADVNKVTDNLMDLVKKYLADEGFRYEIDRDGDIYFRYQGRHLFFAAPMEDMQFFRIFMSPIYIIENNRVEVLEAVNKVTSELKALKAYVIDDEVWLSIEMFIDSSPDIKDYFERCLEILCLGRKLFADEILSE